MHSCGSIELTVQIIFDEITNDIETLINLRFDIVDYTYQISSVSSHMRTFATQRC